MITHLSGTIVESSPTQLVIDVQGVGYELLIPSSSFASLPSPGKHTKILTHLAIRDDAHVLYGFATIEERDIFRLLINTVSGIGPKIALNVLSGMSAHDFTIAVSQGDTKRLSQISGLGKKTAARIVVELKDKLGASAALVAAAEKSMEPTNNVVFQDAVAALISLGYRPADATKRVEGAQKMLGDEAGVDQLVKASLGSTK